MEVIKAIHDRRSVRKYKDIPIEDNILEEIMQDACWAPSGVNIQPWYFVVVKSKIEKEKLLVLMNKVADNNRKHLEDRFASHPEVVSSTLAFIRNVGNASAVVLAFTGKPISDYPLAHDGVIQSVAAAIENMLLSAHDKGISGCWMTAPVQCNLGDEFCQTFALNKGELLAVISLGYAEEGAVPNAPKRKDDRYRII